MCHATQTADRSTGRLETDVSSRPAIDGRLARGDAYPNSIVSTTHKLTKSVPALRYTFRFWVEHGNVSVSNVAETHASLSVFARAATSRCDCEAKVSDVVASSMPNGAATAQPGPVELVLELRDVGGGPIPAGDVLVQANLVPSIVVAAPPRQDAATMPSTGVGSASGAASLVGILVEALPA